MRADKLVLAMNAWSAGVPELAPALFVISSDDAVSTPMPEKLEQVGYCARPADDRFAGLRLGLSGDAGRSAAGRRHRRPYRLRRPDRRALRPAVAAHRRHAPRACATAIRRSPIFTLASSWNGPIDRTASGLPLFGSLPGNPDIVYGYGFSGNGIGMTYLGGQILTSLLLGRQDGWSDCALVRPVLRGFPPEPFRFVGAHFVRGAVRRRDGLEHREPQGRTRSPTWLAGLAPSGVTPSKANIGGTRT